MVSVLLAVAVDCALMVSVAELSWIVCGAPPGMLKLMTSSPLRRLASSTAARSEQVPAEVAQIRSPGVASGRSSVVLTVQTVAAKVERCLRGFGELAVVRSLTLPGR